MNIFQRQQNSMHRCLNKALGLTLNSCESLLLLVVFQVVLSSLTCDVSSSWKSWNTSGEEVGKRSQQDINKWRFLPLCAMIEMVSPLLCVLYGTRTSRSCYRNNKLRVVCTLSKPSSSAVMIIHTTYTCRIIWPILSWLKTRFLSFRTIWVNRHSDYQHLNFS